jgi:hypothetical protein
MEFDISVWETAPAKAQSEMDRQALLKFFAEP